MVLIFLAMQKLFETTGGHEWTQVDVKDNEKIAKRKQLDKSERRCRIDGVGNGVL